MAKPPAEVRFPGDRNRRKKVRVRGIKQASKEIQRRLETNLEGLLDLSLIHIYETKRRRVL